MNIILWKEAILQNISLYNESISHQEYSVSIASSSDQKLIRKTNLKQLQAQKATLICLHNLNHTEASKWLEKVKKHSLKEMEILEINQTYIIHSIDDGKICIKEHGYIKRCKDIQMAIDNLSEMIEQLKSRNYLHKPTN